jgi:ubiquinone/menaquinone biosynthesis C-methylase UbiE
MLTVNFKTMGLSAGDRVLDLGCGEGRHVISLACEPGIEAVGIDLGFGDLSTAKSRMQDCAEFRHPESQFLISQANGLALPFADASFDHVICSEVLEHIPNWEGVLAEIMRVLKPAGTFAVSVPRFWPERICWWLSSAYHEVPGGHIRIFKASELNQRIQREGLRRFAKHWAHALHVPYWWLQCWRWEQRESSWLVKTYHRLLVWDLMKRPRTTRWAEQLLNPLMGKSVVMYYTKDQ